MKFLFFQCGTSFVLIFLGVLLIKDALKKKDFKESMRLAPYKYVRDNRAGSIFVGSFLIILGLAFLFYEPRHCG